MTEREETHNPALEEEPVEPVEKNYRVIAKTEVKGHKFGEVFTAMLNEMEEHSLLGSHLEVVDDDDEITEEGHKGKGRRTKKSEDTGTNGGDE